MTRRLTKAEREVWDRLRQTVKPLHRKKAAKRVQPAEPSGPVAEAEPKRPGTARPKAPTAAPQPKASAPPALAPLEERTRRRLGRGLVEIDALIDLHGMRQDRAHTALVAFLRHAQARCDRIVLVVTGKGNADREGRGVLRQMVPAWLSRPELREMVVGFEEAGRRHGGEGALYVRIRRRRAARSPAAVAR